MNTVEYQSVNFVALNSFSFKIPDIVTDQQFNQISRTYSRLIHFKFMYDLFRVWSPSSRVK